MQTDPGLALHLALMRDGYVDGARRLVDQPLEPSGGLVTRHGAGTAIEDSRPDPGAKRQRPGECHVHPGVHCSPVALQQRADATGRQPALERLHTRQNAILSRANLSPVEAGNRRRHDPRLLATGSFEEPPLAICGSPVLPSTACGRRALGRSSAGWVPGPTIREGLCRYSTRSYPADASPRKVSAAAWIWAT